MTPSTYIPIEDYDANRDDVATGDSEDIMIGARKFGEHIFDTILICEGEVPVETDKEYYAAWQELINWGLDKKLQGSFGRTAEVLISQGYCHVRKNIQLRK